MVLSIPESQSFNISYIIFFIYKTRRVISLKVGIKILRKGKSCIKKSSRKIYILIQFIVKFFQARLHF